MPLIRTEFWMKPIPARSCDWIASYDNDEPNDDGQMACGYGCTEQEAIDELLEIKPPPCLDCNGTGGLLPGIECATCEGSGERIANDMHDPIMVKREGGPTEQHPERPYCKPDQSCCDFVCGN